LKGRGTVATGRVEQGTIKVGEEVEILGLSKVKVHLTFFFFIACQASSFTSIHKFIGL
jgi:translation elongation factor EF-Tu-like GTPase